VRIKARCIVCLLNVREAELERLSLDPEDKNNIMVEITRLYIEILKDRSLTPAEASTRLFRELKKLTKNRDPYLKEKKQANRIAITIYRKLKEKTLGLCNSERLMLAVKASLAGNALDLGVAGYSFKTNSLLEEIEKIEPAISDVWIFEKVDGLKIVFLLDNCGEAVLDRLLAEELKRRGAYTIAVVKGDTFQNDITINEVEDAGLDKSFDRVISTGIDAASVFLYELPKRVKEELFTADIIVSKGMAHFEYLEEVKAKFDSKIVYLLKAKCKPIAEALKVPLGSYVVRLA